MSSDLLGLPTKKLNKLRAKCCNWLERFDAFLPATGLSDVTGSGDDVATGFVVLNGGVLAGCTPFDVRRHLIDDAVIMSDDGALGPQCFYGSTLPFMIARYPYSSYPVAHVNDSVPPVAAVLPSPCATVHASNWRERVLSFERDIARTSMTAVGNASGGTAGASLCSSVNEGAGTRGTNDAVTRYGRYLSILYVLPVPRTARVHKAGSSQNDGPGYLLLLPCLVDILLPLVATHLQRPVLGIQHLLESQDNSRGTIAPADACESPRTCICTPIEEIPGLFCVLDFLSQGEHDAVMDELRDRGDRIHWQYLARRRVAHFNRRFIYGLNTLGEVGCDVNPHPAFYNWMVERLRNNDPTVHVSGPYPGCADDGACDQLTVNDYEYSGTSACGIAAHVDAHSPFGDAVFIVSLGSHTVMEFTPMLGTEDKDVGGLVAPPYGVYLPPRSLVVMTGECRYGWTHSIAERRTDTLCDRLPTLTRSHRVSLTWRRGRDGVHARSTCPYPRLCDGKEDG